MLEKNLKGKIEKIKLNIITGTNTVKITKIVQRQNEIEETLNFILQELQSGVCRKNKF